jgi:integrase
MAYTGMRWSEAMGLPPECVHETTMDIDWKLYELDSRFYRGRPKDGSIRTADLSPFLSELLAWHLDANPARKCTCRNTEEPWCPGGEYVFLGQRNAHHRRSNYAMRIVRPSPRRTAGTRNGKDGTADRLHLRPGLTPHGLRHGHQTWLDELGVRYVLQSERMGHEVPGMRGVYTHITPRMRAELRDGLQELWEASLDERVRLAERSAVGILDDLLRAGGGGRTR